MPRFAANLSMLFTEWPLLDRFAAAADAGFDAVEVLFPYDQAPDAIAKRLADHRLTCVLFNLAPGNLVAGERGVAALPGREQDFRDHLTLSLSYALACGVERLHVLSGVGPEANEATLCASLRHASDVLGPHAITATIEPINRRDVPGYFLADFGLASRIVQAVDRPNVRLQFDIYHRQILHGDVTAELEALIGMIGHVQMAGVPDRGEPDAGELDIGHVLATLDRLQYAGFVAAEYRPRAGTLAGLSWLARWQGK